MRTLQQIVAEITRDAPSARVLGGARSYACVEIPGSGQLIKDGKRDDAIDLVTDFAS